MSLDARTSQPPGRLVEGYVPALALRTRPAVASSLPYAVPITGAVLFADIAGFTGLTARLARRGVLGAEQLSAWLDPCFGQLIDLVDACGGEVYRFAGDAILAVWQVEADQTLRERTLRAVQCALAIQASLHDFRLPDAQRLSLRIAVGAGDMLATHLGGVGGQIEFLLVGDPMLQIPGALEAAQPGQVVLSRPAATCVDSAVRTRRVSNAAVRVLGLNASPPPLAPRAPEDLTSLADARAYVLPSVLARLDAGQTDWLAELRRVSVVFVNVEALDCWAADGLDKLQALIEVTQTTLATYEGSLCQSIMDDKGIVLHCPFGVPPYAHADDAARAALAAARLASELRQVGLVASIGVATGQAFCGPIGTPTRRDYNLKGDVVNLAASLAVAARGDVYCDAATVDKAGRRLRFEPLQPRKLKGRAQAVPVFRCLGAAESLASEPDAVGQPADPIVGRAAERATVGEQLAQLHQQGAGGVLVIEGEPGLGKSRLLGHVRDEARARGLACSSGSGDPIDAASAYQAWRSVFRQLVGDAAPDDLLARLGASEEEEDEDQAWPPAERLLPLLNAVLPLDLPENELTAGMTDAGRADFTRELLVRLMRWASQQDPLVLLLDDAQWLDSASWALARAIGDRVGRVLLVLAMRPPDESAPADCRLVRSNPATRRVVLANVARGEVVELVTRRLGVATLSDEVTDLLWTRAEGHPFYSVELALALRDAGLLQVEAGHGYFRAGAGSLDQAAVPSSLQAAITARIDHLSPAQQLILKVGSVVGRQFGLDLLRAIYPAGGIEHLTEELSALEASGLILARTAESQPTYHFEHALTQEVAYNLLPFAQRRQLHRAAAEWYQQAHADDLSPYYALLAYHWSRALPSPREAPDIAQLAITYLERAGQQAAAGYANLEAIRCYEDVLRVDQEAQGLSPRARRAGWEQQLGEAYFRVGKMPEAIAHLQRAAALLGVPAPRTALGLVLGILVDGLVQVVHRLLPRRFVRPPASEAGRARLHQAAEVYASLSLLTFITLDELRSIGSLLRGHNLAERAGPSGVLLRTSYQMSNFTSLLLANSRHFEHYIGRAHEVARQVNEPASEAELWFGGKGFYLTVQGRWTEADDATSRAQHLFASIGDRRWTELSLFQRANIAMLAGQTSRSLALTAEALESAERRGDAQSQAWLLIQQAHALVVRGQSESAVERLDEAERRLAANHIDLSDPAAQFWSEATRALAQARLGNTEAAWAAAEAAASRIKPYLSFMYYAVRGFGNLAEASCLLWERACDEHERKRSQRLAARSAAAARSFGRSSPFGRPQALVWQARCQQLSGQREQALRTWQDAVDAAEQYGMPYEAALAHSFLGQHGGALGRHTHLYKARELFQELEAQYHLTAVEVALATSP